MRLLKSLFLALFMLCPWPLEGQVPVPQLNLSGNVGCIGFPCVNTGTYVIAADTDTTLPITSTATSAFYLKVTSSVALTATRNFIYPAGRFPVGIENATTGGQSLNVCGPTGSCVTILNSTTTYTPVWNDGTNFIAGGTPNAVVGTGTSGDIPLWNGSNSLTNSPLSVSSGSIFDSGTFNGQDVCWHYESGGSPQKACLRYAGHGDFFGPYNTDDGTTFTPTPFSVGQLQVSSGDGTSGEGIIFFGGDTAGSALNLVGINGYTIAPTGTCPNIAGTFTNSQWAFGADESISYCANTTGSTWQVYTGSGVPGGSTNSIQFKNGTAFGGSSSATVNSSGTLTASSLLETQSLGSPAKVGLLQSSLTPPLSNSPVGYASWTHAIHFGTSITFGDDSGTGGFGALCSGISTDTCDTSLNDVALGIPLANKINYGVPGYFQCDITNTVFNDYSPTIASGLTTYVTMESGDNENQGQRNNPGAYAAVYESCIGSAVTWLDTPLESKTVGSAWTLTSGWSSDTTYAAANGVSSTTNASAISSGTFTLNNSFTPIVIWYDQIQGNGGVANYAVFDVTAGTTDRTGTITLSPAAAFGGSAGTTHAPGFVIIAPFATTANYGHTFQVNFTVTSATSASNIVRLLAVGTGPDFVYQNYANWTPNVWVADAHILANDIFGQSTASFQGFMKTELWNLKQSGFPFTFDEMQNSLNGQAADYGLITGTTCTAAGAASPCIDYPHPNASGHAKRSSIWLGPGTYVLSPPQVTYTTTLNGVAFPTNAANIVDPFNSPYGLALPNTTQTLTCSQDVIDASNAITLTLPSTVCNPVGAGKSMLFKNGGSTTVLSITPVNGGTLSLAALGWAWVTQLSNGAWVSMPQGPPYSILGDLEYAATNGAPAKLAGPTAGAGTYFLADVPTGSTAVAPTWINTSTLGGGGLSGMTSGQIPVAATATTVTSSLATTGSGTVVLSASPALTGAPTAPTATVGTNTTQVATTAFVLANAGGGGGVTYSTPVTGNCVTSGTMTWTEASSPYWKQVTLIPDQCVGSINITFPVPFTNIPSLINPSSVNTNQCAVADFGNPSTTTVANIAFFVGSTGCTPSSDPGGVFLIVGW